MRSRTLVSLILVICAVLLTGRALAQDATPAVTSTSNTEIQTCTAEPRDINEMLAHWFDSNGEPLRVTSAIEPVAETSLPQGPPASQTIVNAISETTRNWILCTNVLEQYARGFSYLTDDLVAQFGPDAGNPSLDSPEEVGELLEGQIAGTPISSVDEAGRMPGFEGPRDTRVLDTTLAPAWSSHRVGAIWSIEGDRVFVVYEQHGERWLIDEVIDIVESADPGDG